MTVGFVGTLWWAGLVLPYWFLEPPLVSPAMGFFLAVVQWLLLALAVAVITRRFTAWLTVVTALFAVIGGGVTVVLVLRALGHNLHFEMP
jgi:hypothetical protein